MTDILFRHNILAAWGFAGEGKEWKSGIGMPQWITYKLKEKAAVCKITFLPRKENTYGFLPKDCPKNYRIEGSHDGHKYNVLTRVKGKKKRSKMAIQVNCMISNRFISASGAATD